MAVIVVYGGGFQPFHVGHLSSYLQAKKAFPEAAFYVAASNDTKTRPIPFNDKQFLAQQAGVTDPFVEVKAPINPREILDKYNPEQDIFILIRSERDPVGYTKKDGSPGYYQPFENLESCAPFATHGYVFVTKKQVFKLNGQEVYSGTQVRDMYTNSDDQGKVNIISQLYPKSKQQKMIKKLLDKYLSNTQPMNLPKTNAMQKLKQKQLAETISKIRPLLKEASLEKKLKFLKLMKSALNEGVAEGAGDDFYAMALQKYPQLKRVDREIVINALNNAYEDYLMHYGYEGIGPEEESSMIDHAVKGLKQGVAEGHESDAYGNTGEKHECGSCDGTGIVSYDELAKAAEYDDVCPECGGKGWVRDKESLKKKGVAEDTQGLQNFENEIWQSLSNRAVGESQLNEIDPGLIANLAATFPALAQVIINSAVKKAMKEKEETAHMVNVLKKRANDEPVNPKEDSAAHDQFKDLVFYGVATAAATIVAGPVAGVGVALSAVYKKELLDLIKKQGYEVLIHLLKGKGIDIISLLIHKFVAKHILPIHHVNKSIAEDWQKVNKSDKTDGMSGKAVSAYRRENPGSKLKTAVTTKPSKLKKGSKDASRRKSFCARMGGMKKHNASAKTKRDPDSPINKALRRWNCESIEEMEELVMIAEQKLSEAKNPAQQAAIAINMKKNHKKPKTETISEDYIEEK